MYALMSDVLPNVVRARTTSPCERPETQGTISCLSSSGPTTASKDGCSILLWPVSKEVCDCCRSSPTSNHGAGRFDDYQDLYSCSRSNSWPDTMRPLHTHFLSFAALRHHIDGGHCHEPPPDDPPLLWHRPVILSGLHGGTFDHLMACKSLARRLGYDCGLCGHQSGSSASLLKHLNTNRNSNWNLAASNRQCTQKPWMFLLQASYRRSRLQGLHATGSLCPP